MKQKDIALIIIVVFFSAVISFVASGAIFGDTSKDQKAEVVQAITSDFKQPDDRFFNQDAFDPTQTITIEQNANPDPFRGTGQ